MVRSIAPDFLNFARFSLIFNHVWRKSRPFGSGFTWQHYFSTGRQTQQLISCLTTVDGIGLKNTVYRNSLPLVVAQKEGTGSGSVLP
jgi:hypothetical protein